MYYVCVSLVLFFVFFFFKQKTEYEVRISDWSSDVCSSDLTKAAFCVGRILRHECRRAAIFAAGRESLDQAEHYEECGSPKSDAVERRDKADRQRRAGHQQYRECKHGFSSEPVAQRSPEQSAQRPHEKGYRECRQREQGRLARGAGEQSCGYIGQAIGIDAIIEPFGGVAYC